MIGRIISQFRFALVILLAIGVVVIDSISRTISMLADLALIGMMLALVWPLLQSKSDEN